MIVEAIFMSVNDDDFYLRLRYFSFHVPFFVRFFLLRLFRHTDISIVTGMCAYLWLWTACARESSDVY